MAKKTCGKCGAQMDEGPFPYAQTCPNCDSTTPIGQGKKPPKNDKKDNK